MLLCAQLWSTVAVAAEPTIEVTDAGVVRGRVFVSAPPEVVRALLLDTAARVATIGDGMSVTTEPDGACLLEHTLAPNPVVTVTYTVRGCPTDDGFRSELVESADLTRMISIWKVAAGDGGSWVSYDLDVASSLPLPTFVVRRETKSGVAAALAALSRHFAVPTPQ